MFLHCRSHRRLLLEEKKIYIYMKMKAIIKTLVNKYYIYILQYVTKNEL